MSTILKLLSAKILSIVDVEERGGAEEKAGQFGVNQGIWLPNEAFSYRIPQMQPNWEDVSNNGDELLGHYRRMSSPGEIVLYEDAIASVFWHYILDTTFRREYYIDLEDLANIVELLVLKVLSHMQFHHFCDVARHLFDSIYHQDKEEALSVAWSYLRVESECERYDTLLHAKPLYRDARLRFFKYECDAYRDWILYSAKDKFDATMVSYIGPPTTGFCQHSGIDVAVILRSLEACVREQGVTVRVSEENAFDSQ